MEVYIIFIVTILLLWIQKRRMYFTLFKKNGIPGPEPNIFFGNLVELYRKNPVQCHKEWIEKYGRVVGYFKGVRPVVLVADPEMLKNVLITDFQNFANRESFHPVKLAPMRKADGLTIDRVQNKEWKDMRGVTSKLFTASKLRQFQRCLDSPLQILLGKLKKKSETGEFFNVMENCYTFTLDVGCRIVYGETNNSQISSESEMQKQLLLLQGRDLRDPIIFIGVSFPFLHWFLMKAQQLRNYLLFGFWDIITSTRISLTRIIRERRQKGKKDHIDFLQCLLNSKLSLQQGNKDFNQNVKTDEKVIGEAVSKKNEANETSRNLTEEEIVSYLKFLSAPICATMKKAIGYLIYFIALRQDIQEKLYEEIKQMHEEDANFSFDVLSKFKYMENVIKEIFRLYPFSFLFMNRLASEDIQYGDYKIPRGASVQAAVNFIHHDPEYWDEPDKFDDDRWNNDNTSYAQKNAYYAFGMGPRNCVGMRLAQMISKQVLAHLFWNFKFTLADGQEILKESFEYGGTTLKNLQVKVELRSSTQKT